MAQFYTDFSEYTVGTAPYDWLDPLGVAAPQVIEREGADNGIALRFEFADFGACFWDKLTGTTEFDLLVRLRMTGHGNNWGPGIAILGDDTGLSLTMSHHGRGRGVRVSRWVNGSWVTNATDWSGPFQSDNWVYHRITRLADGTLNAKTWGISDRTEENPIGEVTTSSISFEPHMIGIGTSAGGYWVEVDWMGVGTDGDPAPTEPVGGEDKVSASIDRTLPAIVSEKTASHPIRRAQVDRTLPALSSAKESAATLPAYPAAIERTLPALQSDIEASAPRPQAGAQLSRTLPALVSEKSASTPVSRSLFDRTLPAAFSEKSASRTVPEFVATLSRTLPALQIERETTFAPPVQEIALDRMLPALQSQKTAAHTAPDYQGSLDRTLPAMQSEKEFSGMDRPRPGIAFGITIKERNPVTVTIREPHPARIAIKEINPIEITIRELNPVAVAIKELNGITLSLRG